MQSGRSKSRRVIDSMEAASDLFASLAQAQDERLHVAHLAADGRLIGVRMSFGGSVRVLFSIRAIVTDALRMHSRSLILAHNHPSGDPEPTFMDMEMTRELVQAIRPLKIALRDHIIFAGERVTSFRARGLL